MTLHKPLTPLLDSLDLPTDIRHLTPDNLTVLAKEVREFLIYSVHKSNGHFGANLGTIELTIALLHCFDPKDNPMVWDVGHQTYPHKILTGRKEKMHTIRQTDGLSPFLSIDESEYDAFGAGHAGTSISAATGFAYSLLKIDNSTRFKSIAIIGDGGMTCGMAFEALNHAGAAQFNGRPLPLITVFNDNQMSISENVGALAKLYNHLSLLKTSQSIKSKVPENIRPLLRSLKHFIKAFISSPGSFFQQLGFEYIGPINGHDFKALKQTFLKAQEKGKPCLIHVLTIKGKGFAQAEAQPVTFHALPTTKTAITYADVFGQWACNKAKDDDRFIAITPAMTVGSGLSELSKQYPDKLIDVGIAEQHAVTIAGGLCRSFKPVVAIYSTFLQRAYDQLLHDICLQNLDVTFCVDRSGIVGGDGATHQGIFDINFSAPLPNIVIMMPSNYEELQLLLNTAYNHEGPAIVRYPRGSDSNNRLPSKTDECIPLGQSRPITMDGKSSAIILSFGTLLKSTQIAAQSLEIDLIDMRFVAPLDETMLIHVTENYDKIITCEEHVIIGGCGSLVNAFLNKHAYQGAVLNIGLTDPIQPHGDPEDILDRAGLSPAKITETIQTFLNDSRS